MNEINLIPDQWLQRRRRRYWLVRGLCIGAVLATSAVLLAGGAGCRLNQLDARIARLEKKVQPRRAAHDRLVTLQTTQRQLARRLAAYDRLRTPLPVTTLLGLLERAVPRSIALTRVSCTMPPANTDAPDSLRKPRQTPQPAVNAKAGADQIGLALEGLAIDQVSVGHLVHALSKDGVFQDVTVALCRPTPTQWRKRAYAFRLTLTVPTDHRQYKVADSRVTHAH